MLDVMPEPRASISQYAPRILTVKIDQEKIGAVIGPGGKMIRKLQEEFGVKIDIEEDGTVFIASTGGEGAVLAQERIRGMTRIGEGRHNLHWQSFAHRRLRRVCRNRPLARTGWCTCRNSTPSR